MKPTKKSSAAGRAPGTKPSASSTASSQNKGISSGQSGKQLFTNALRSLIAFL